MPLPDGRAHAAFGFTGNGVGPSHLAGRALAALALGQTDGAAALPIVGPPPKVPPEPFRVIGAAAIRRALVAKEAAEQDGRTPEPGRAGARRGPGADGHAHRALTGDGGRGAGHRIVTGQAVGADRAPRILEGQMTLADRVKQDLTSAMKAGEKDRVGALRLVLSELQKDAKEGTGDELAVLRRERKRRLESAAAFRDGGRAELADAEEAEARADRRLPAGRALRRGAARDRRGRGRRDRRRVAEGHGRGDEGRDAEGRRARRRQARLRAACRRRCAADAPPDRALQRGRRGARRHAATQVLRALEGHLDCDVFLRGNVVTLDGDAEAVAAARRRRARAVRAHRAGPRDRPGHDRRGARARSTSTSRRPRSSRTSSGATARRRSRRRPSTRSATSTRSAATRSRSASARPAPARRSSPSRWPPPRSRAARSTASSSPARPSRPASASGFLPGDLMAKVDPYLRPLFDALHDMLDPEKVATLPRARRDRGRAAGVHARPHAERLASSSSTRRRTRGPSR